MKILYIIPNLQHPKLRGPTRHYHFVSELARRHGITLLSLNRSKASPEAIQEVASHVEELHLFDANGNGSSWSAVLPGRAPRRIEQQIHIRDAVQRMKQTFVRLIVQREYDLVVFHGKSVFPVIEHYNEGPLVVDFCDATSMRIRKRMRFAHVARRPLLWLRYVQVRRIERRIVNKTPHTAFISPRDREAILSPTTRAEILPNGVDHQYWQRGSALSQAPRIVFTGVMDYAPNEDAAIYLTERIVPRIRESIPDLEVLIVGRDPSTTLIEKATRVPNVTVTGFVEDVRPYLENASVFAAPLRYASGTQNKVLEALAMEVPVVTTSVVADGLRVESTQEPPVCVAESESDTATKITRLLRDSDERARLAAQGRQYVEAHFSWSRSAKKLERMCLDALNRANHGNNGKRRAKHEGSG